MKAIGFKTSLPIKEDDSLIIFDTEKRSPGGRDLLVKIKAVSVNPVDCKMRKNMAKGKVLDSPAILGWDAAGVVEDVGAEVQFFKSGDEVFYAGDNTRSGCNSEYHLVDERIAGRKPASLNFVEAAALPLTSLTAWEAAFDRINILPERDSGKSALVINGGGGVGSIAIQILKKLAGLKVIATASRPETEAWCKDMGADVVVNHHDLVNHLTQEGIETVDYIFNFVDIDQYWDAMGRLIKPVGRICCIVSPREKVSILAMFRKSVSLHWELMFTRPSLKTPDMVRQHEILNEVSDLIDKNILRSTLNYLLQGMTVENLKKAHSILESGKAIGKIVVEFNT